MGWAVIQKVAPYHPEGDPKRPEVDEFVHWVFDTQRDASRYKADLMLAGRGKALIVKSVTEESWTPGDLAKKKKAK